MSTKHPAKTISLTVESSFRASHSLEYFGSNGLETPHFHEWKLSIKFSQPLPLLEDKIVDIVFVQNEIETITAPLSGSYLNSVFDFAPTSENLAQWLWKVIQNRIAQAAPSAILSSVKVTLCNLDGVAACTAEVSGV